MIAVSMIGVKILSAVIVVGAAAALMFNAPASADEYDFSGCESWPMLGLNPYIRKICDDPIQADGSWTRYRQSVTPTFTHSSCGGRYYLDGCPPWMPYDTAPAQFGGIETYVLTAETVPPGEPGHLDNPVRCKANAFRCDVPAPTP